MLGMFLYVPMYFLHLLVSISALTLSVG